MRLVLFAVGLVFASACSVGTDDVDDSEIWGEFAAVSDDGSTVQATVSLFLGAPLSFTWVTLEDDDTLTVSDGGEPVDMQRRSFLGVTHYEAAFDAAVPDTEYAFDLSLASTEQDYAASASLPSPFTLTAPSAGASFSRSADAIEVSWSEASSDSMSAYVDVTCDDATQPFSFPADAGATSLVIPVGAIAPVDENGTAIDGTCDAYLAVWRRRSGEIPEAFLYGSAVGAQVRGASIVLEP